MFCSKCGKEIADGSAFCPGCGNAIAEKAQPAAAPATNKLHCPNCKSTNITITTESSVNGGLTTHHGGVSSTHLSNTHRNFWICSDCGTKFRNIQSLEEEISRCKNTPTIMTVITCIGLAITLWLFIQMVSTPLGFLMGVYFFGALIATVIFFCFIFSSKKKLNAMRKELEYLKENCFN